MGTTMTGIIEWTEDAVCAADPKAPIALGEARWHDDHIGGMLFDTDKEYDFFAAIAGVRSRFNKQPLILPRGVPSNLSWAAQRYFEDYGDEGAAGWLHLSEIDLCVEHMGPEPLYFGFEVKVAMEVMRLLVNRLNDAHVRLVFNIG